LAVLTPVAAADPDDVAAAELLAPVAAAELVEAADDDEVLEVLLLLLLLHALITSARTASRMPATTAGRCLPRLIFTKGTRFSCPLMARHGASRRTGPVLGDSQSGERSYHAAK
jgi:hypothetical protein